MTDANQLVADFVSIAELAGVEIPAATVRAEVLPKPHTSPRLLPSGKMAVYVFLWGDLCLKVGKVGPRSQARYTSQHYNPRSSNSNLAKSILKHKSELGLVHLGDTTVGDWIKAETGRINFLLDQDLGVPILSLMEAFLQCRLRPKFEGFESQK